MAIFSYFYYGKELKSDIFFSDYNPTHPTEESIYQLDRELEVSLGPIDMSRYEPGARNLIVFA